MKRIILFPAFLFLTFLISYMNADNQKNLHAAYKGKTLQFKHAKSLDAGSSTTTLQCGHTELSACYTK